jgi:hypothetical protein
LLGLMETQPVQFLDVPALLERSEPRPRVAWTWYGLGGFLLLAIVSGIGGANPTAGEVLVQVMSGFLMVGLMVAVGAVTWSALKEYRAEQAQVRGIEELMQLRRWTEAAMALEAMLSRPARSPVTRVQALVCLAGVLARYHRFGDALAVQDYLLEHVQLDPAGEYGLKLGRAMAMLREDHLLDADRAISGLRRIREARDGSGALALVEMYRDVKTGHPHEAIEIFQKRLVAMRDQLGHRVADGYALVARAYDMVGRADAAGAAWGDATVLAPAGELVRRYPEVRPVAERYAASAAPVGVAW